MRADPAPQPLIRFQDVYRDAIQSLLGTNPSAQEIIDAYPNAHLIGTSAIQTGGGTFFDIFAKKGRDEWAEIEKILSFFRGKGITQSALIRGDFLFSYEPQSADIVTETARAFGRMGMNVFQNFHGTNDIRALRSVAEGCRIAREQDGSDLIAQGTICIEDNPGITIDSCLKFAEKLVESGHRGFYLKSANGVLDGQFVHRLTSRLLDEFDQDIGIHVHSTYGKAPLCYLAAIEAAIARGRPITIDVQHPAMSGSTAHASMLKMLTLIQNHHDPAVRDNAPHLNVEAIKADMHSLFRLRFRYREYEAAYDKELLSSMERARVAGGASATLKSIPGLVDNIGRLLGTRDWTKIQTAIYDMQQKILPDLGYPTQVTPYAANTTGQAAISLTNELQGKMRYDTLYPGLVNYLVGRHGQIPEGVSVELTKAALKNAGLEQPEQYVCAADRPNVIPAITEKLISLGIEKPTTKQAISAAMLRDGARHVLACYAGENKPQMPPALPFFGRTPAGKARHMRDGIPFRDIRDAIQAIGGIEKLQEIAERALHLKQIDDGHYEFSPGQEGIREQWRTGNVRKLSELMDNIVYTLRDAGFCRSQIWRLMNEFNEFGGSDDIFFCIRETCRAKGPGLYDHMLKSLTSFKTASTQHAFPMQAPSSSLTASRQMSSGQASRQMSSGQASRQASPS